MCKKKVGSYHYWSFSWSQNSVLGKKVTKAGNSEVPRMERKKNDRQLNSSQQNCSIELKAKLMYNQLKETIDVEEAT